MPFTQDIVTYVRMFIENPIETSTTLERLPRFCSTSYIWVHSSKSF